MGNEVDSLREEIKELEGRVTQLEEAFKIAIGASTALAAHILDLKEKNIG